MDAILLLLQAEGGAPAPEAPPTWPLLVGFILIFYFLMFRPQIKEQKRRREMLTALKKNDKVVTNGGMHGTIVSLGEDTVVLKVDDNVRIKFSRAAIAGPAPGQEPADEKGA